MANCSKPDRYQIFRKNVPYLYDSFASHTLDWPSLTVDWLPSIVSPKNANFDIYKIVYGTHTSNLEPEFLTVCEARLPCEKFVADDILQYESTIGFTANPTVTPALPLGRPNGLSSFPSKPPSGPPPAYNNSTPNKSTAAGCPVSFHRLTKMLHPGEVNRAVVMPQDPFIIATISPSGNCYIYDYSKHPSMPLDTKTFRWQAKLTGGHTQEGTSVSWNHHEEGHLASGASDCNIFCWDINSNNGTDQNDLQQQSGSRREKSVTSSVINPLHRLKWHCGEVNDVCWHPGHRSIIGSAGDDGFVLVWDCRSGSKPVQTIENIRFPLLSAETVSVVNPCPVFGGGSGTAKCVSSNEYKIVDDTANIYFDDNESLIPKIDSSIKPSDDVDCDTCHVNAQTVLNRLLQPCAEEPTGTSFGSHSCGETEAQNDNTRNGQGKGIWATIADTTGNCGKASRDPAGSPLVPFNCIDFNLFSPHVLATGDSQGSICIWDMRNTCKSILDIHHNSDNANEGVTRIHWSPNLSSTIGASIGSGVEVWNIQGEGCIPDKQLLLHHGGHTSTVSDFAWAPAATWRDEATVGHRNASHNSDSSDNSVCCNWSLASVAEDNILHIWTMSAHNIARDITQQKGYEALYDQNV